MRLYYLVFLLLSQFPPNVAWGKSRILDTAPSPEDLKSFRLADGSTGLVVASKSKTEGRLEVWRPGSSDKAFAPWYSAPKCRFHPVGIWVVPRSSAPGLEGKQLLYAINLEPHPRVSVFEIDHTRMKLLGHLESSVNAPLPMLNSITALPDGTVIVSSFHSYSWKERITLVDAPLTETSACPRDALYCFRPTKSRWDFGAWSLLAHGWGGANGLAFSEQHQSILLATFHTKRLHILPWDTKRRALSSSKGIRVIELGAHPDNVAPLDGSRFTVCTSGSRGVMLNFILEGVGVPWPWNFYRPEALEVNISQGRVVRRIAMPRNFTLPSTAWEWQNTLYASRVFKSGVLAYSLSD